MAAKKTKQKPKETHLDQSHNRIHMNEHFPTMVGVVLIILAAVLYGAITLWALSSNIQSAVEDMQFQVDRLERRVDDIEQK